MLDGDGGQSHTLAPLLPGRDLVPLVQDVGWAIGRVWIGVENIASTGILSPDHSTCSKSLNRLCYPGPQTKEKERMKNFTSLESMTDVSYMQDRNANLTIMHNNETPQALYQVMTIRYLTVYDLNYGHICEIRQLLHTTLMLGVEV